MATYFLDFDRTLFDTSAFLKYLIARDGREDIYDSSETDQATAFNAAASEGLLSFAPGELQQFMFDDAEEFLDRHEHESVVVTYGNIALQKAKLENVFAMRKSLRVIYTGEERKGPFIARLLEEYPEPYAFFDDKAVELQSVGEQCPHVALYEMRRDGTPGASGARVLRTLQDFSLT